MTTAISVSRFIVAPVATPRRRFIHVGDDGSPILDRLTPREVHLDGEPMRLFAAWLHRDGKPQLSSADALALAGFSTTYHRGDGSF